MQVVSLEVVLMRWHSIAVLLAALCSACHALHPDVLSSVSETPRQRRRRRLAAQPAIQTDPGADGIAIGLDGNVYSDTAITAAVAQVGQLGPLNPKVAVCHFPASDRSQYTVKYLAVVPLIAAQLVKNGDFLAPSYPQQKYGYGCILYDHFCSTATAEPCNLHGTCQTNNTCFCSNSFDTCRPRDMTSGCETNTGSDFNNCGACGNVCADGQTCCNGVCVDLNTDQNNCGVCNFLCNTIPGTQTGVCTGGQCTVSCDPSAPTTCQTNSGLFCVNLNSNPNFCGTCNTTCPSDINNRGTRLCSNGTCGIQCSQLYPTQCGATDQGDSDCANLNGDILNCGSCGTVCPTDPSAITICSQGTCIFQCTGGTTKCGTIFNPICTNTLSDNNNCGSCGFVCQSSYSCVSGVCTNTNFGKKLLEFPSEETGDEAAEDMEGALAEA
ncbi:g7705 [Coccomyxa viridis]|uniref:G7705 protein n=1 Tax=Coccomyxa viridis TaxID=1274662 RepID=A0ABP1FZN8_9CHLO